MSIRTRINSIKKKIIEMFYDDSINLDKYNSHPDEIIFEGWDKKESKENLKGKEANGSNKKEN
jgi:hypothetical protein